MKILLLKPPILLPKDFSGINARFSEPVGLEYITSMLIRNGYNTKIIDCGIEDWKKIHKRYDGREYAGMSFGKIGELVATEQPDLVGITCMTPEATNMALMISEIRKACKGVMVVVGGAHACVMPEQVLEDGADFVCIGEGEYMMLELVKELEKDKPEFEKIRGMYFKKDGKMVKNEIRPFNENLDELPFPARHLVDYEKYFKMNSYLQGSRRQERKMGTIITSRGCPFGCVFCAVRLCMGRNFRPRSPENVVAEIDEMVNKYGMQVINFEDDNFTMDADRVLNICDLIIKRGLNKKMVWETPNGIRADRVDEKLLLKMQEAGCVEVIFSPESGNQYVVDNIIGKRLDLKKVEDNARICKNIGLSCKMFFVIGLPGETKEQIGQTLAFAKRMKDEYDVDPIISPVLPYYGTDLYNICKDKGYMPDVDRQTYEDMMVGKNAIISTPEFASEYILEIKKDFTKHAKIKKLLKEIRERPLDALRAFLLRPKYILKSLVKK